jgi:ribonuclease BN (tRNA processing enzyme)
MNITFLGTGSMGSDNSANTSILINEDILLDIGSGTINQMMKYNHETNKIKYIIITHYHADHFLDIAYFIFRRAVRGDINNQLIIVGPQLIKEKIIELLRFAHSDGDKLKYKDISEKYNIKFIELIGDFYSDDALTIKSIPLIHGQSNPCNGYIIDMNNIKIGYTGDTTICSNLYNICSEVNHIIIDANEIDTTMAHVGLSDVIKLSKEYPSCTFYAVHRSNYSLKVETDKIKIPKDGEKFELTTSNG